VEGDVVVDAGRKVVARVDRIERRMRAVEPFDVGVGGPLGSQAGGLAFQHLAEFEQVLLQHRMAGQHLLPGIDEVRIEPIGDVGAPPVTGRQHPL